MRKSITIVSFLAISLSGCAPTEDPRYRAREARPYPNPTQGTDNSESQWYRTQTIASPSAPSAPTSMTAAQAPATNAPARVPKTPVPSKPVTPRTNANAKATPAAN